MTAEVAARSYLESFASGDPEAIARHVTNDFINEHTAGLGSGCVSKATYRQRLEGFLSDMVDVTYEIEQLVTEGNQVAAFYCMRALWQGETPIKVRGVQRLEFAGQLIQRRTDYWDSAVFLCQADPAAREALAKLGISHELT